MSLRFRSYTPTDQTSLIEVIDSVCAECVWMLTRRFEPTPAWTHALATPDCPRHLLLVTENPSIVGWCRLFSQCRTQTFVELGIGLLSEYRGHGIGTALIQSALAWADVAGYRRVTLDVHLDNARARHVFERSCFRYGAENMGRLNMTRDLWAPGRVAYE